MRVFVQHANSKSDLESEQKRYSIAEVRFSLDLSVESDFCLCNWLKELALCCTVLWPEGDVSPSPRTHWALQQMRNHSNLVLLNVSFYRVQQHWVRMACTCLAWKVIYKDRCSKPIFRPFFRLCYKKSHNLRNVESTGRISDYKNKKAYDITYEGLANCNNKVKHS